MSERPTSESSTCSSSSAPAVDSKPVLERLQQFLKEKNPAENSESPTCQSRRVDLNQNTIFTDEDPVNFDLLRQVLDYKKSQLLRQPDVVAVLKTIAENHRQ